MSLTTNITGYYKLDGNSNDSVGSNNGTDTAITYNNGNGKINNGAGFNGTTSQIVSATNVAIPTNATISFWFKTTQSTTNFPVLFGYVISSTNGFYVRLNSGVNDGKVLGVLQDSDGVVAVVGSISAVNDGNWHFVVFTKTGSNIELFVDSVSQGTSSAVFTGNFNNFTLEMGVDSGAPNRFYSGATDECGYWSRVLSGSEISQLYNNGGGLQYPFTQSGIFNFF